jgi:O-antigen chain-terminating methyltransferase
MNNSFYRAFEDRFRGSRELIKERLIVYLPFAVALEEIYPDSKMVDIGCGRGEWLELLNEHGISALGVDQDVEMLKSCKELGLHFIVDDAFSYIKSRPDNSISILSAFHLVEHLDFNILQELIKESLRVLKPGGLIILETPNPENIAVGTKNFYIDPTHIRPVPQELLSFITEFYGFERTKVLRLQECEAVKDNTNLTIKDVIFGASQDYAIIAQKKSKVKISSLDELFEKKYGISTEDVALRYENKIERLIENVNFSIDDSKSFFELSLKKEIESNQETMIDKAQQSEAKVAEAEAKTQQSEAKVAEAEAKAQQ